MLPPIKIMDEIHHKNKYRTQVFHVIDRMPVFFYEQKGKWLIGEDSGFFNFYYYDTPYGRFRAFAGRKFSIPLKNGDSINATGQWWSGIKPDYQELLTAVGVGTPEGLGRCNVFTGMWVDAEIVKHTMNPSNNYNKYDKLHPDFGKHKIESRWGK